MVLHPSNRGEKPLGWSRANPCDEGPRRSLWLDYTGRPILGPAPDWGKIMSKEKVVRLPIADNFVLYITGASVVESSPNTKYIIAPSVPPLRLITSRKGWILSEGREVISFIPVHKLDF